MKENIFIAQPADGEAINSITARAGVFSEEEVSCVAEIWDEYLVHGAEGCGYHFLVFREGGRALGFASYGFRDLTDGVYDLFWIATDSETRRGGVGRKLLSATEAEIRKLGGRIVIAETSGTAPYDGTRKFYESMGYRADAVIKDFYRANDDLFIYVKRL
ncbi:MAG: GNAT family N-acetyltransferase [Anaerolineales bacterium]|nr:GNAT family N-acetyltransferase [Anaerolineales bacterium]